MPVAVLKPFRRGNDLLFRGVIGNAPTNSVSVFYPFRIGQSVVWRGKDCDGKVLYAWPFRRGNDLLARTAYRVCGGSGCSAVDPCPNVIKIFKTTVVYTANDGSRVTYINCASSGPNSLSAIVIPQDFRLTANVNCDNHHYRVVNLSTPTINFADFGNDCYPAGSGQFSIAPSGSLMVTVAEIPAMDATCGTAHAG